MKIGLKIWRVMALPTILILLAALVAAAFFLTAFVYRTFDLYPPALVVQIINALLGLLFLVLIIYSVSLIVQSGRTGPQRRVFRPIIDALERIARGDFSVRLDEHPDSPDNLVSELVKSVNNMAQQLNQIESMRQEFISNVSHEIQSPLTSMRGFARLLQSDELSAEDRHHYLAVIESESTRLSRITDNLLRLASLEARQVTFEPKPYRLDRQIRDLLLACEPQWTAKALEMDVALQEVTITADEDLLSQVWINLIHNGIKFSQEGGTLSIGLQRGDDVVGFRITDSGVGIPEEDQARVFERFYKVDKAHSASKEGSGLGLSIARKIVEMHGGTIGLESTPGSGATFTVTLPAETV